MFWFGEDESLKYEVGFWMLFKFLGIYSNNNGSNIECDKKMIYL